VSAVKIDGKRAYQRVREGEDVVLASRRVRIDAIDVTRMDLPELDVTVHCSSGTYIRSIARDLGTTLGVGGHLTVLRRTAVGPYTLAAASTLDALAEDVALLPIADAARATFPAVDLDDDQAAGVRVGRKLDLDLGAAGPVAVFAPGGEFLALYEQAGDVARPVAVFV
jgi:tRNA pseudouridine55 synthase